MNEQGRVRQGGKKNVERQRKARVPYVGPQPPQTLSGGINAGRGVLPRNCTADSSGFLAAALGASEGDLRLGEHASLRPDGHRPSIAVWTLHQEIIRFEHREKSSIRALRFANDEIVQPFRPG